MEACCMGNGPPWEMDPPEHIHGHLLGGSISHGGPFPMQQAYHSTTKYSSSKKFCRQPLILLFYQPAGYAGRLPLNWDKKLVIREQVYLRLDIR